uniref:Hepatitis A virus cellular receptor 1-like n=1 Tax=Paramormyrops kingsleyae TaxID=1676925 RepID=A0A3B3S7Y2_9TELE|nr:hepatitis A virus cellular receptor 1 homolog isoform X6 [Paramormyrops kingsleyae]
MRGLSSLTCAIKLLLLLAVSESSAQTITGFAGRRVTLPCKYNGNYYGRLPACWGRGAVPLRGCSNRIISTNGRIVTFRSSARYLLEISQGDVSLTILNAVESDSGTYGCRVDIPGLFNDQKRNVFLMILKGPPTTTQAPVTSTAPTEPQTTTGPPTTTQAPVTSTAPTEPQTTTGPPTTTQAPMTSTAPTETTRTLTSTAMDTHAAPVKTDSAAMLPSPVHPASFKGHSPASAPPPTSSPWRPIHENTEMLPTASTERKDATHPDFSEKWKDILRLSLWILLPGSAMFLVAVGLIKWRKIKASGSFNLFRQSNAFWQRQLWKKQEIQATYQRNQ